MHQLTQPEYINSCNSDMNNSAYNKAQLLIQHKSMIKLMSACKEHYLMEAVHHLAFLSALFQALQDDRLCIPHLQLVHITQNHSVLTILTMLQKHRHWYLLMLIIMPPYNAGNLHTPPGKKSENTAFHHFRSAVPVQPVTTNHTYKCCGGGWNCCFQTG